MPLKPSDFDLIKRPTGRASSPNEPLNPPAPRPASAVTDPEQDLLSSGHTPTEICVAKKKSEFVRDVWDLSKSKRISAKESCALVAARTDCWQALTSGGKNGTSLIAGDKAYLNYRSWLSKLGRNDARQPASSNWRSLLPAYRGSKKYVRPGDPDFWAVLKNLYENENRLSLRYAWQLSVKAYEKSQNRGEIPTYNQVYHWYERHADQKAVLLARQGEEWFKNNVVTYINRGVPKPGECWVGDHHIFDAPVRVWDKDNSKWRAARPWLTAWLDWGSLSFVGVKIRVTYPNRDVIERSLKDAILQNNNIAPVHLYVDNGKDYKSALNKPKFGDTDISRVEGIAAQLGCRLHWAIPYNARAKIIERMFAEVCRKFSKLWQGYRGSNPQQRPERADVIWNKPEELPTLDEFAASFQVWLETVYGETPSNGKTLQGKTPNKVLADAAPARPALEADLIYKAFLRQLPRARRIIRGGAVRALNRVYRSEKLWRLFDRVDEVIIKINPDNVDNVWVYAPDGRELCSASAQQEVHPLAAGSGDPTTIEQVREEMRLQRRQINETKRTAAAGRMLSANTATEQIAASVFDLPDHSEPESPKQAARAVQHPRTKYASEADIAELDALINEDTLSKMAPADGVDVTNW